jgi:hypothetical protein
VKALALLKPQLHLNKNTKLNEAEKPTTLNCSKDAHIIFEVFSFNTWVRHCEELIREDWKKLMGNLPIEDIPLPQNHLEDDWG